MVGSAFPHEGFSGSCPDAVQVNRPTTTENAPATPCGAGLEPWRGSSITMPGGVSVNHPSWRDDRTASVEDGTHSHNLPQQAMACLPRPAHRGGARGRSGTAGSALLKGRQASRGGDGPQGRSPEGKQSAQRRRRV